jgi:hypothetical protein
LTQQAEARIIHLIRKQTKEKYKMSVKFKPNETFVDRQSKVKTVRVFPMAGVKTSELVALCTKPDSDLRRLERKTRVKARKELIKRGVSV